jgi:hypothetical protein
MKEYKLLAVTEDNKDKLEKELNDLAQDKSPWAPILMSTTIIILERVRPASGEGDIFDRRAPRHDARDVELQTPK